MSQDNHIPAYTAGIIDGEGCISILKCKERRNRTGYSYRLEVVVANTDERLVNWLKATYGGHSHALKQRKTKHKPSWQWQVWGNDAALFLEPLLPYLLIKREQARIAISFQEKRSNRMTTDADFQADEQSYQTVRQLNMRGVLNSWESTISK